MTCTAWKQSCSPWCLARLDISGEICQLTAKTGPEAACFCSSGYLKTLTQIQELFAPSACSTLPASLKTPPVLKSSHWIFVHLLDSGLCDQEIAWSQGRMLSWSPKTPKQKITSWAGQAEHGRVCCCSLIPAKETLVPSMA